MSEMCYSWKIFCSSTCSSIYARLEASSECPRAGHVFKFLFKVEQAFRLITGGGGRVISQVQGQPGLPNKL